MNTTIDYGTKVTVRPEAIADHHAPHYEGKTGVVINTFDNGAYVNVLWEKSWTSLWKSSSLDAVE